MLKFLLKFLSSRRIDHWLKREWGGCQLGLSAGSKGWADSRTVKRSLGAEL
jgi:hypothetical protein